MINKAIFTLIIMTIVIGTIGIISRVVTYDYEMSSLEKVNNEMVQRCTIDMQSNNSLLCD